MCVCVCVYVCLNWRMRLNSKGHTEESIKKLRILAEKRLHSDLKVCHSGSIFLKSEEFLPFEEHSKELLHT